MKAFVLNMSLASSLVAMVLHLSMTGIEWLMGAALGFTGKMYADRTVFSVAGQWSVSTVAIIYTTGYMILALCLVGVYRIFWRQAAMGINARILLTWFRFWASMMLLGGLAADFALGKGVGYILRLSKIDYRMGWLAGLVIVALMVVIIKPLFQWLASAAVSSRMLPDGQYRQYILRAGLVPVGGTALLLGLITNWYAYRTKGMLIMALVVMLITYLTAHRQQIMATGRRKVSFYGTNWLLVILMITTCMVLLLGLWKGIPTTLVNGLPLRSNL